MTASAILEMTMEEATTPTPPARRISAPAGVDRIVLTGFMGSGKTTVGRLLAETIGWAFHDLDDEIERRTGRTVPQIFAESGEEQFRRQEASALASLLGKTHIVLALGGGAPESLGNRLLLEQTPHTAVVYLSAPLATLITRCERQAADGKATERPLLGVAAERFQRRHPLYERIAGHQIATTERDAQAVVIAIVDALAKSSKS